MNRKVLALVIPALLAAGAAHAAEVYNKDGDLLPVD
ncbi:Outer membrane protein C [Citrobacter freundii]|uniref:Outer membrane protein C n=1 Tax=Citrobacter freundii TaxID=546 RepID=A0AAD1TX67_CITFR|nr:Outer membrane protein C [Citrobacter freundii]CAH6590019.1 Outer membrane protein C [Citrobacter freundii]SQA83587.1 Outer membrane porin protein [Citrobacter freundii]